MSDISANNKRIAKNTFFLYIRMGVLMIVGLYTSRVVLNALGVEDFGIYNVVAGVVSAMTVLQGAMSVSVIRYLTFELGKGEENFEKLHHTFCIIINIYFIIALIFLVLAETLGLWFTNTQLTVPQEKMTAVNWIYQFSILSSILSLFVAPYNAIVVAHERMAFFSGISILEGVLKLGIAFAVMSISSYKLETYGFLMMMSSVSITACYIIFCNKKYAESRYEVRHDKALFKELATYTGWNLFGSLSGVAKGQGLNILLNIFFTPAVNAARAIAYQVNTVVSAFLNNFYMAVRPQITKYYAQNNMDEMFKLVFRSSKFAYYLILLVSLPIVVEAPYIIKLWLGQLPDYVVPFVRLIIMITIVDAMATPLMTTIHATGKIALYQSVVGTLNILNLPVSYCLLKFFDGSPIVVFYVSFILAVISLFARLLMAKKAVGFPVSSFILNVVVVTMAVTVVAGIPSIWAYGYFIEQTFVNLFIVCVICLISCVLSVYFIGLSKTEKSLLRSKIRNVINDKFIRT